MLNVRTRSRRLPRPDLISSVTPRAQQAPADAPAKKVAKAAKPAPPTKEQLRLAALKKEASADIDALATLDPADGGLGVQLRRARLSGDRVVPLPHRHPRAERVQDHARHLGHPDGVARRMGQRQAGDRAWLRHRRHPAGLAEARRRLSRSPGRGRAGARRGAQLRHPAQHHRRDRGEEADGAREAVGHPSAVAGRCRGAGGRQGVVRARRAVQGRRHLVVRACRQQLRHLVGPAPGHGAGFHRVHASQARPRTARARRGAARARSTRSS